MYPINNIDDNELTPLPLISLLTSLFEISIFDKIIKSLVQNGFDYEFSKNILHRYLSKC